MTLEVQGATRSFGGVQAAQDVTMSLPPGAIIGLIGPNGAGKTTVVNLITGILRLDRGHILVDGRDISRETVVGVAHAGVSRTFQNVRLLPDSSVLDNVTLSLTRRDRSSLADCLLGFPSARRERRSAEEEAMRLLGEVGMADYAGYVASGLAYGHQRRVEIARAVATGPKYILLDEPVAGMNDVEAHELGNLFRRYVARGIGILLIEHNMRFVNSLCSHVYVLNTGAIIAEGSPSEIARDPAVISAYLGA